MSRWIVACDACEVRFVTGGGVSGAAAGTRAWCEGCQRAVAAGEAVDRGCPRCAGELTTGAPRFEELFGQVQDLAAVVETWAGRPESLRRLLPERPRYLVDLTPPPSEVGDAARLRGALEALARGAAS
ncbi:MAG: hypothetical protein HOP12_01200, partial [Candidatus Eisenbacteria bacterium]|nr:hypothetical protein [Candidatus Eisenbacteria bacterium]